MQARDHQDRVEIALLGERCGKGEQAVAAHQVDLVERQDRAPAAFGEAIENAPRVAIDAVRRIDQQHRLVGVLGPGPGRRDHRPVEPPSRREDAGRVDIDDLRGVFDGDAEQAGPRRLRLWRDDRQLAADEPVEQRRFAGIGRADQRDIAAGADRPLRTRSDRHSRRVLLRPLDHVGVGREPDAGLRLGVADDLVENPDARAIADDVRVHGQLEDAALVDRRRRTRGGRCRARRPAAYRGATPKTGSS